MLVLFNGLTSKFSRFCSITYRNFSTVIILLMIPFHRVWICICVDLLFCLSYTAITDLSINCKLVLIEPSFRNKYIFYIQLVELKWVWAINRCHLFLLYIMHVSHKWEHSSPLTLNIYIGFCHFGDLIIITYFYSHYEIYSKLVLTCVVNLLTYMKDTYQCDSKLKTQKIRDI